MPFISDAELSRLNSFIGSTKDRAARAKAAIAEKADMAVSVAEMVGTASAMGFARGKFEEADGSWNIPGTSIDIELAVGLAGVGAGMAGLFGKKYDSHVVTASGGILSHYSGQVFRKFAKTKKFSLVAGAHVGYDASQLMGNPNFNQLSFNPTQHSDPYADPVAMALAQSGV